VSEYECSCPYTDSSTWLSAASCGYGSGYEPGSMQENDPDCPEHGGWWCEECQQRFPVDEVFDDQIGYEEQAREVRVTRLGCGHEIVEPIATRWVP